MSNDWIDACALAAAYGAHIDAGRHEEFAALFALDGVLAVGAHEVVGRTGLVEFSGASPRGVHTSGLPHLVELTATTPWVFVGAAGGAVLSGHYRDAFVRDSDGGLLFARRDVEIAARVG